MGVKKGTRGEAERRRWLLRLGGLGFFIFFTAIGALVVPAVFPSGDKTVLQAVGALVGLGIVVVYYLRRRGG